MSDKMYCNNCEEERVDEDIRGGNCFKCGEGLEGGMDCQSDCELRMNCSYDCDIRKVIMNGIRSKDPDFEDGIEFEGWAKRCGDLSGQFKTDMLALVNRYARAGQIKRDCVIGLKYVLDATEHS